MSIAISADHKHKHHEHVGTGIDPVCGMKVDIETSRLHWIFEGKDYHFCSARCREKFQADPETYLKP